jgi:hypothetical protein
MRISEKREIVKMLQSDDVDSILSALHHQPALKLVNPLIAALCSSRETVRWNAVAALGPTVAAIAGQDMERARIIMRRFMWSLNDESGGIGWGAPEAMAEIMVHHPGLAAEFGHILVSYMREDGNFLEHEALQRGLLWGIARLAMTRPELMRQWEAPRYLVPYLHSGDAQVRGLAVLGLGILEQKTATTEIKELVDDPHRVRFYWDGEMKELTVGGLAAQALAKIND